VAYDHGMHAAVRGGHSGRRDAVASQRGPSAVIRRVADEARTVGVRDGVRELRAGFDRNDLLTYASAISFQVLYALIPLALFGLALLGGAGLSGVWTSELAPRVRDATSPAAFEVIDNTVRQVLSSRQAFWATAGALLAVWEMSGALRTVIGVLNRVYEAERTRPFVRQIAVSLALGAAVIVLIIATVATMEVAPRLVDGGVAGPAVDILRWPAALGLLWATCVLVIRVAPAQARPRHSVTLGSTLVVLAWLVTAAGFAWYLTHVANYGSVFGALATVVVMLTYLYASSIAFVTGVQIDAIVQLRGGTHLERATERS
jgi:membrane protein